MSEQRVMACLHWPGWVESGLPDFAAEIAEEGYATLRTCTRQRPFYFVPDWDWAVTAACWGIPSPLPAVPERGWRKRRHLQEAGRG